jgi:arabinoxylan arabinofuranohydrolase
MKVMLRRLLRIAVSLFMLSGGGLFSQNPITPAGVYIADPSAHAWPDGKLYIYGSLDESPQYYCSWKHHVLVTEDLKTWNVSRNAFSSKGDGDAVPYNDDLLFAPDCAVQKDTFYLYYCQPSRTAPEGVATSLSPTGPFTNGQALNLGGHNQIDPSLFVDDDGQAYYIWGQFTMKMAKMKPSMRELELSTLRDSILTEGKHHFHEGAFLAKRNGIYYLIYADISRAEMPTCIGYSTSTSPFGPYKYGGVIVDNDHCDPGNWNNHGSIVEFKDNWYVLYHRSTHGCNTMRKACIEPIHFNSDGSIPEVEMTSQGAGGPLPATSRIDAERACLLYGSIRIQACGSDNEELAEMGNGDKAVFKYVDFGKGVKSVSLRVAPGEDGGRIVVAVDQPWHKRLANITIAGTKDRREWQTLTFDVEPVTGVHAVWLQFFGKGDQMFSIDWLTFN